MSIKVLDKPKAVSQNEIVEAVTSALKKVYECDVKSIQISMHIADGVYCTIEAYGRSNDE